MPNLQEPHQAKQKTVKWFQLILIIAAVLLGAGYLFRLLTPTQIPLQPIINRNYQGSTSTFEKVTFIGIAPNLPAELSVGTAENFVPLNFEDRTVKEKLITRYDLQRHPAVPTLWMSPTYGLQEIEETGSYELISQVFLPEGKLVDTVLARQVAQNFVDSIFPENNLQLLFNKIIYRHADVHGDIVEAQDAELVEIPFGYTIDTYPIFLEKSLEYPVTVIINADNQVQKAVFHPFFLTPKIDGKIETLTLPEALANINSNKATIVSSRYEGFERESLEKIVTGSMSEITIEYRVSAETKRLVPYYKFSGSLTNDQGQEFYGEIITPAVQTQDSGS